MSLDASQVIKSAADTRRPLIHYLAADNSWLLQIPHPGPRLYFNLVIDPWLLGFNIEIPSTFHHQGQTVPPAARSIAHVEQFARQVEDLSRGYRSDAHDSAEGAPTPDCYIDAVAISQPGTDHCNKATLLGLPPTVPVIAYGSPTVKLVQSWKHFDTVVTMPEFTGDWRNTIVSPLPDWIGIGGITKQRNDCRLHYGIVVSFGSLGETPNEHGNEAEAVVYMPHGIPVTDPSISTIASAAPRLKVLAVLHGFLRVLVGGWLAGFDANLGAHNGLAVQQALHARYWIPTHDGAKTKWGLTSFFLTDFWLTLEEAASAYATKNAKEKADVMKAVNCHELGNGAGLVLA